MCVCFDLCFSVQFGCMCACDDHDCEEEPCICAMITTAKKNHGRRQHLLPEKNDFHDKNQGENSVGRSQHHRNGGSVFF